MPPEIIATDCFSLFDDLDEYIKHAFADPQNMLMYMHIPKAAGSSTTLDLEAIKTSHFVVNWQDIQGKFCELVDKLKAGERFEMASGHFRDENMALIRENNCPHDCVTFIRHPIRRLISEYRYMCTPAHPPYKGFLERFKSFEEFTDAWVPPNLMGTIMVGEVSSFDDYLAKLKQRFKFIGMAEFYDLSMAILLEALGQRYTVKPRHNVTEENDRNRFEISHKTYQDLLERHSLDMQVYEYFYQKYAKLSNDFIRRIYRPNS